MAQALDLLGVDPFGLDSLDRRYLKNIIEKHDGDRLALKRLQLQYPKTRDVEEVVEPYLLQLGL